jgi:hypothetical protein
MWDRRIVKKLEDYVGRFSIACSFRCIGEILSGGLWVCMVLKMIMIRHCFGRISWNFMTWWE